MSGGTIRILFEESPVLVNENCSRIPHFRVGSSCQMPGLFVEIIALMIEYLNLTVVIPKITKEDSNYNYIYDELYNNETDLYGVFFMNTSTRSLKFDFTDYLYMVSCLIIRSTY